MMVLKASKDTSSLVILTQAEKKSLTKIADFFDIPAIVYDIALFEKLRWPVKNSDNPRALLEASLLRVALAEQFMSIPDLLGEKRTDNNSAEKLKKNIPVIEKHLHSQPEKISATEKPVEKPVLDSVSDIEQVKQSWDKIIDFVKSNANVKIAELIKKAVPLRLDGNILTLGFSANDEFSMNLCQSNGRAETIQQALTGAMGLNLRVSFETISETSQGHSKPKPRGAKTSQKTIDQAANTPVIKNVLSELEANIIEVSEEPDEPGIHTEPK
jgi:DNA polymerase-3 subunit gamma/tau